MSRDPFLARALALSVAVALAAELLVEGESGFVRDALDVAGIASVLDQLEGGVAHRVGAAARAAVEHYTPAAMARKYLDLYRRLLRR